MLRTSPILCAGFILLAATGCRGPGVETDETSQTPPAAETGQEPAAKTEAMPEPEADASGVVWADESSLSDTILGGKDVIYLPTPPMVVDKMIELAEIQSSDLVYDLGTGDGRMAIEAARQKGCKAIGYEINPDLVKLARENVRKAGLEHLVTIEEKDILTLDFSPADVVLMYLTEELNVRLIPQFQALKPGARVVSHDWGMAGKIEEEFVIENFQSKEPDFVNIHNIYMWKAPMKVKE